jgi:hypothetical protein
MIDDVDFLLKNSIEKSVNIYIDSSLRNKLYYPYPNSYTIAFDQPIKNVFGVEVLDGAIPNSMYNIDVYNNDVYFTVVNIPANSLVPIDPQVYMKEIITSTTFIDKFNNGDNTYIIVGVYSSLSSFLTVSRPDANYLMFIRYTLSAIPIINKTTQIANEYYFFTFNNNDYALVINSITQPTIDILIKKEFSMSKNIDGTYDIVYYDIHIINKTIYNQINNNGSFLINVNNYHLKFDIGNYDIITVSNNLNNLFNPYNINLEATSQPPILKASTTFTSTSFFLLNCGRGTLLESLGFDSYPQFTSNGANFNAWTIGDNIQVFSAIVDTTVTTSVSYMIVSPGLINLLGQRFCILHIEELDDHINGSYSYMNYTPGIGMFKMASATGGITNLRFDYVSLIRTPFHPIGKLSKLSLKFLTRDGKLYDFKGVNHQLLFAIKFRVPMQKETFTRSILNPNYDPDIMQYMAKNQSIEYKEDSDDEQEFDDEEHYQTYKKELDKYDYSTSEDEDEQESDDETEDSEEDIATNI